MSEMSLSVPGHDFVFRVCHFWLGGRESVRFWIFCWWPIIQSFMSFQIQIFHVPDDGRVLHSTGGHSEKCIRKQGSRPTGAARRVDKMPEQKEFIMDKVDQGSILTGPEMWEEIQKHVNCGNENVVGMDRTQVRAAFVVTAQSFPFSHYDYPPNQCIKYLSNLRNRDSVKVGELDRRRTWGHLMSPPADGTTYSLTLTETTGLLASLSWLRSS